MKKPKTTVNVVLVHGAWADGSSWAPVIELLQLEGLKVVAAPIPLTSLSDDAAALDRVLERTEGPVVLVAHAYAGAVIGRARMSESGRSLSSRPWRRMRARPSPTYFIGRSHMRWRRN